MQKDILILANECLTICRDLVTCLEEERVALMGLNTEVLVQVNFKKENLGAQLKLSYQEMSKVAKFQYQAATLSEVAASLSVSLQAPWQHVLQELKETQIQLQNIAQSNQKFLKHSLKNLSLIVDNLKRLFGDQPLYSQQGKKVEGPQSGRMVEASY